MRNLGLRVPLEYQLIKWLLNLLPVSGQIAWMIFDMQGYTEESINKIIVLTSGLTAINLSQKIESLYAVKIKHFLEKIVYFS